MTNHSIKLSVVIIFALVITSVSIGVVPKVSATISVDFNLDKLTDLSGLELLRGPPGPEGPQGPQGDTGALGPQGDKRDKGDPGQSTQPPTRTATLIVIKHVDNSISGSVNIKANDFIMHVNGNNPSPYDFPGSGSGTNVAIGQGPYAVTESNPLQNTHELGYFASYSSDCVGTINDGETDMYRNKYSQSIRDT